MIITDIAQIDRLAEETFGEAKGIISVDMKDYGKFDVFGPSEAVSG